MSLHPAWELTNLRTVGCCRKGVIGLCCRIQRSQRAGTFSVSNPGTAPPFASRLPPARSIPHAHLPPYTLHAVHPGTITHPIHCHTPALSSAPPCPFAALQIQQGSYIRGEAIFQAMTLTVVVGPAAGRNCGLAAPPLLEQLRTEPGRPAPHP